MGSVGFNDLCIHPGLKFPPEFKYSDFEKYDGRDCPYPHLRLYDVAMAQYGEDDNHTIMVSHPKGPSQIKKIEMNEKEVHTIQGQLPENIIALTIPLLSTNCLLLM